MKAKSYEFRSEAVRGMHITYPTAEPVVTPRAREGLRAVVPTIYPPSAVNRGESVHVHQQALLQQTSSDGLIHIPKKRGPKPKPRFKDGRCSAAASEPHKRRAEEQGSHSPHKLAKLQGGEERRLMDVAHRHPENHAHSHKHHHHHHYHHHHSQTRGSSYKQLYSDRSLHSHRSDLDPHRTKDGSGCVAPAHLKQNPKMSHGRVPPAALPLMEKPYFLDRPSPTRLDEDFDEVTWRPCLSSVEKVLVTDVTSNFLTVTIKESSTSQGFFKDKR